MAINLWKIFSVKSCCSFLGAVSSTILGSGAACDWSNLGIIFGSDRQCNWLSHDGFARLTDGRERQGALLKRPKSLKVGQCV